MAKPLSLALFEILGHKDNWITTLTFLGHVTLPVTWPLDSPYPISYSCPIVTKPLSPALFEILGPKNNWVTTSTFLGHVTSSVTWPITWRHRSRDQWIFPTPFPIRAPLWTSPYLQPFSRYWALNIIGSRPWPFLGHLTSSVTWPLNFPYPISYSCNIVAKPLSLALFEILGPKDNWVTILTFSGHVTSSLTWPLDSPYPFSYSWPIVTKPLSPAVFEIFGLKSRAHTPTHTHTHTHTLTHSQTHAAKWFYILSHARYCIGQTNNDNIQMIINVWSFKHWPYSQNVQLKNTRRIRELYRFLHN